MMTKQKTVTLDLALTALFAALIAVCSWVAVPLPTGISFTLQTFAVLLATGLLGRRRATLAVLVYLLLGAVGVPVFTGMTGGIGHLTGTTGGYLVGFLLAAELTGLLQDRFGHGWVSLILAMTAGLLICYLFGTVWFMVLYTRSTGAVGVWTVLGWCVLPYLLPDAAKILAAAFLTRRLARFLPKQQESAASR